MADQRAYRLYRSLKEKMNLLYRGYPMQPILATSLLHYAYQNQFHPRITLRLIKSLLFSTYDFAELTALLAQNRVIFSMTLPGDDHRELVRKIAAEVHGAAIYTEPFKRKPRVNWRNLFSSFAQVARRLAALPLRDRVYFAAVLTFHKNLVDELESWQGTLQAHTLVASFNGNIEPLFVQFFKKRNLRTFALQHGVHGSYLDYPLNVPADVINLENFTAGHFLGWGDFTRQALVKQGFSHERYVLAGHPKYSDVTAIRIKTTAFKSCLVCLARDVYFDGNAGLLAIASQLQKEGISVVVKFHPRSDRTRYRELIKNFALEELDPVTSIRESIAAVHPDFVIVYNSTVYYEYYLHHLLTFRYGVNENDLPFGLNDQFCSYDELMVRMRELNQEDPEQLNAEINRVIGRFCALGVNRYAEILNQDIDGQAV